MAGAAIALRYVQRRHRPRSGACPAAQPWTVLGAGLLIAVVDGDGPAAVRRRRCSRAASVTFDLPLLGEVKVTSALAFDVGVYLVVVGLALMSSSPSATTTPSRGGAASMTRASLP